MKRFFLTGGFIGFALTFTSTFAAGGSLNTSLRNGMLGCLLLAFGFRMIYRQLQMGAIHILEQESAASNGANGVEVNGKVNGTHEVNLNGLQAGENEE